jgi:hypothetical protein
METLAMGLAVGVIFVLPQVIGFGASRIGRRFRASWPLGAAATVGVLWALALIAEHGAPCGTGRAEDNFFAPLLLVLHAVVGSLLGTLDRRARRS